MHGSPILFLEVDDVIEIHRVEIERFGGSLGVRDQGLLESAVDMPRTYYFGEFANKDIFEMAAAYLFHLVANHPFIDGNKRAGAAAAAVFLDLNGYWIDTAEPAFGDLVIAVATGTASKDMVAQFFEQHCRRYET